MKTTLALVKRAVLPSGRKFGRLTKYRPENICCQRTAKKGKVSREPDLIAQLAGKSSKDLVTPRKRKFRAGILVQNRMVFL
jgi:hypothetical protein